MEEGRISGRMERESYRSDKERREGEFEEYREVTLTQTAYKVYASVLTERLKEEVE